MSEVLLDDRPKWKIFLDNKATWAAVSLAAGTFFGDHVVNVVTAIGAAVMAVL